LNQDQVRSSEMLNQMVITEWHRRRNSYILLRIRF